MPKVSGDFVTSWPDFAVAASAGSKRHLHGHATNTQAEAYPNPQVLLQQTPMSQPKSETIPNLTCTCETCSADRASALMADQSQAHPIVRQECLWSSGLEQGVVAGVVTTPWFCCVFSS